MTDNDHEGSRFVHQAGDGRAFSLAHAFACAGDGLRYAFSSQRNFKIHAVFAALAIILGFALGISGPEWCAIAICIMAVFALELVNTAIESAVDLISTEWSPLAKHAKDCAAAGVYVAAIGSVVIACIVYVPALLRIAGII